MNSAERYFLIKNNSDIISCNYLSKTILYVIVIKLSKLMAAHFAQYSHHEILSSSNLIKVPSRNAEYLISIVHLTSDAFIS